MDGTAKEVIKFIRENDIKFIRLAFCDLAGVHKNVSVLPDQLETAFEEGMSIDGSNIAGFLTAERSDIFLMPDPATLGVLPWRPQQGRVARFYCYLRTVDGPCAFDGRRILARAVKRGEALGLTPKLGTECEFYLFKTDQDGCALTVPLDAGGYLDVAPLDRGENVRREICLCLEEMGLGPERSHHESGPGQNEIDFKYSGALEAADNMFTFKSTVKAIAARNGLYASFMPKPFPDQAGSGLHVNISLSRNGQNGIKDGQGELTPVARSFMAGILSRAREMAAVLNPLVNSYDRLGVFEAPGHISWSRADRTRMIRIPDAQGQSARIELRSPDCAVNPYLAFALILNAGFDGVEQALPLGRAAESGQAPGDALPSSLSKALGIFRDSAFVNGVLGKETVDKYVKLKTKDVDEADYLKDKAEFYMKRYFPCV